MKRSEAFEHQIRRIYDLLEESGAEVTWNDRIADPDNPARQRQIDITIRRGDRLVFVECRDHSSRQDVQWIEELIGRRASLGADLMIAVSSSGFTDGAFKKAIRYGIVPRDLRTLTEREVHNWGQQVALRLYFYQYSDLELSLLMASKRATAPSKDLLQSQLQFHPAIQSVFNAASRKIDELGLIATERTNEPVNFRLRLQPGGLYIAGNEVLEAYFRGTCCLVSREVNSSAVLGFGRPDDSASERETIIQAFPLGETSIVHIANRISTYLDVSKLEMPPFCQFRFFRLLGGSEDMNVETLELVGLEKLWIQGRMQIGICLQESQHCEQQVH